MSMKVLVVGGVAGGASAAARVRRLDEQAEVIMFEKGPHVSFSNCSLPYHLSGIVEDSDDLVLLTPEDFKNRYKIEARVNSEVCEINRDRKTVTVRDGKSGQLYEESYDKLFLSPGAQPIVPNLPGATQDNVFTIRNVVDIERLNQYIQSDSINSIAVVGGGFIGVEVAENLRLKGKTVSLVEFADQIMLTLDYDMAQILQKEMLDHEINLVVNDGLAAIREGYIETQSGRQIKADAVVLAIGVRPDIKLAKEAGLEIGSLGGIQVDHNYLTSDKDIYAVGDAIEVFHMLTHQPTRLALAGPAQRQARAAADHLYGNQNRNRGVIGSSSIRVFDLNAASTGLTEKAAMKSGLQYDSVYVMPSDRVSLMPGSGPMYFKLVYEVPTGRILGAQAIGGGNTDKRIDVIGTMIQFNGTIEDLKDLELSYSPMFGTARDVVNQAALVASNQLYGKYNEIKVSEVRELVEQGAFIIDAREADEYESGHLNNAVNIPFSEFRSRLDEIPGDQAVYIHCRSGQRSYNMVTALQQMGLSNVFNISGSFLGISLYEYYNDQLTGREKILSAYNFD